MTLATSVKEELSGSVAKSYVSMISGYHRIQASTMYREAAEKVAGEMRRLGLEDVQIIQFPADGKRKYWLYRTSPGWTVKSAELRLIKPKQELLADFEDIPTSLHTFSQSTPEGGVTAELVDVGSGIWSKDYKGKKVRGKIVLATGGAHSVHVEAVVKRGAAGVITDTMPYEFPRVRQSIDLPDARAYQGIWPYSDYAKKVKFGFSLTKRQGDELRGMLSSGKKVVLKAQVDARMFPGKYDIVTATIRGSSKVDEEIFLTAHLCHPKPGANDNASGSGMLMEIARTIKALIDTGKIKRPARTIRFYWVPETTGTVALLSTRKDLRDRLVAGINLDMVGEDQTQCDSTLHMSVTPDSLPSYLNDLVYSTLEASSRELDPFVKAGLASKFRFVRSTFSPGSDHAEFVEAGVGVPCVSFTQWPDRFYHTSMDTIDRVSEDSLRRVGWTVTMSVLRLANADARACHEIAILTHSKGVARIADAVRRASEELFGVADAAGAEDKGQELARTSGSHKAQLEQGVHREREALRSVLSLARSRELEAVVTSLERDISEAGDKGLVIIDSTVESLAKSLGVRVPDSPKESPAERESRSTVPVKRFRGTIPWSELSEQLSEEQRASLKKIDGLELDFGAKIAEVGNLMDGRRSVHDIVAVLRAEYGPTRHEDILLLLQDMKSLGLVQFRKSGR